MKISNVVISVIILCTVCFFCFGRNRIGSFIEKTEGTWNNSRTKFVVAEPNTLIHLKKGVETKITISSNFYSSKPITFKMLNKKPEMIIGPSILETNRYIIRWTPKETGSFIFPYEFSDGETISSGKLDFIID
jgi:hypothetical protein